MPEGDFEEKYLDVLQNIEANIVSVYREHPEMVDWDALKIIETLIREYQAEQTDHPVPDVDLKPLPQEVYVAVKAMCEWRLGRNQAVVEQAAGLSRFHQRIYQIVSTSRKLRVSPKTGGRAYARPPVFGLLLVIS
jgi:hypothetical protein